MATNYLSIIFALVFLLLLLLSTQTFAGQSFKSLRSLQEGSYKGPVQQMMAPHRCGVVADNMGLDSMFSIKWAKKWSKTKLSYGFDSSVTSSPDMLEKMRAAMQQAFSEWQRNSGFTFIQNPPAGAKPDIVIGFYRLNHEKGTAFKHCIAYALPPPFGQIHFHADENWSIDPTEDQFDLVSVALHEIGHVLGLRHLSVKDAVMSPDSHYGVGKRKLHRLDIAALAVMYNQWGRFLRTIFS